MKKLISLIPAGLFLVLLMNLPAQAQVNVDVGGGANGSAGGADVSVDADISTSPYRPLPPEEGGDEPATDNALDVKSTAAFSISQEDAAAASIDAASAELSAGSVTTSDDLSVFATAMLKRDANLESVDVGNDKLEIRYRKEARFLGFVPTTIRTTATVASDGTVSVDYPWYRFLFSVEGGSDAEAELKAQVDEIMASSGGTFSATAEAALINAMHLALMGEPQAGAGTTADMAGDVSADENASAEVEATGDASVDVYPQ